MAAMPRRSVGGHHILLWVLVAMVALSAAAAFIFIMLGIARKLTH
ncbi:MAG TPA: hypothetical protein VER33_05530 [Polyangiaceae bacterium]|nr:hypothetical protein [Polyangiaceae bacterium]